MRRADGAGEGESAAAAARVRPASGQRARPDRSPKHPSSPCPQVEILDDSCDAKLQYLWGNYTNPPVAPVAGCDAACLSACYTTLNVSHSWRVAPIWGTQQLAVVTSGWPRSMGMAWCVLSAGRTFRQMSVVRNRSCSVPLCPPLPPSPPLQWAIYSEAKQDCPHQTDIIACFHVSARCPAVAWRCRDRLLPRCCSCHAAAAAAAPRRLLLRGHS